MGLSYHLEEVTTVLWAIKDYKSYGEIPSQLWAPGSCSCRHSHRTLE